MIDLDLEIYEKAIPLLTKSFGVYYDSDYYVTKKGEKQTIEFNRFCFDVVSLVGQHLLKLTADDFETILRRAFHSITYCQDGKLQLLDLELVESVWAKSTLEEYLEKKVAFGLILELYC